MECNLCYDVGGRLIWENDLFRVVDVQDPNYPGFIRVIWQEHAAEVTDLSFRDRTMLMERVFAIEALMREYLNPDKVNLASLGNVVPHVHWHIIPRYKEDMHFPQPIWGAAQRELQGVSLERQQQVIAFHEAIIDYLDD